jgi:hypothetical protein
MDRQQAEGLVRALAAERRLGFRALSQASRFVLLVQEQSGAGRRGAPKSGEGRRGAPMAAPGPEALWAALDVAVLTRRLPSLLGSRLELQPLLSALLAYARKGDLEDAPSAREASRRRPRHGLPAAGGSGSRSCRAAPASCAA